jgi:uncharacterized protein (DUF1501 family)
MMSRRKTDKKNKAMNLTNNSKAGGLTRRNVLKGVAAGCAAMSQTAALSTLFNLTMTQAAAAAVDTSRYKALVCLFLHGGIDSYNLLLPTDAGPYADYQTARGILALDSTLTHPISDPTDGRAYGLHPGAAELQALYNTNNLAFVANVGSLLDPVDQNNYGNGARLPLGLFSHSDQQRHWQTATPQSRTQITGWLGRCADAMDELANNNPFIPMNIAVDQLNILQTGDTITPYVVSNSSGAVVLSGYGNSNAMDAILTASTDNYLNQSYSDLLKDTFAIQRRGAIDAAVAYNEATSAVQFSAGVEAILGSSNIGRQLRQVARAIGAHGLLDQDRQVFYVDRGGWDHHTGLLNAQGNMIPDISATLAAFYQATVELGMANEVVTFTASDFARTLNGNSNAGSDHAWGGNHVVMGGAVNGGRLYGTYPDSLAPGNALDIGRGRLIPTTSVDALAADLAMWFGIPNDSTLETILPNIRNFYSAGSATGPLGMIA